ncbi:MAG TPA: ATP-binding protein [Candidatus Saccharimonadia bacterium]|nr:ATP-binding protein [Candidatus Saccharimonadia bacterium]
MAPRIHPSQVRLARAQRSAPRLASDTNHTSLGQWLAVGLAVVVVATLLVAVGLAGPGTRPYDFAFNPYALLSLAAVAGNVAVLIMVGRLRVKTDDLTWFSLYVGCLVLWSAVEFLTRISAGPVTLLFWWPLVSVAVYVMPVALYMFVLSYTNPRQGKNAFTIVPLMFGAMLLVFFDYRTPLLYHYGLSEFVGTPWGGAVATGPYYAVILAWVVGLYLVSAGTLMAHYRRTLEPTLRQQMRLFIAATLIPVVVGGITDGVLPSLGDYAIVVPLATVLTAVSGALIGYGILRYRFLSFSPLLVATNILQTMNEAVIGVRPDFKIDYANDGAARLLGYDMAAFGKRRFTDFLSQDWNYETVRRALFGPLDTQPRHEFESVDLRTADGRPITVKLSISRVVDEGHIRGYVVVMTDITEMAQTTQIIERRVAEQTRQVQEARATLVTSVNSLRLGFILVDPQPEVFMVNTEAHHSFCPDHQHHTAASCRQVTLARLQGLMGTKANLAEHIRTCLRRQLPFELKDVSFLDKNWRIYLSPMVVDRRSIGCAVVLQDVTQERLLERSRDEFFSIASHELRTPLTSIKGNSSLILQYYQAPLKDKALKEMVTDIHESSDRLIEIVNDFLDASRLEQGKITFHLEELSMTKLIEEVVYEMGPLLKQKGVYLKVAGTIAQLDHLPHVVADKNRLKQVLINLLGNAAKFTDHGGITVEAGVAPGNLLHVTVTDTGTGISPQYQQLLFRKFQQAGDSLLSRDASKGTGLGLYISRLLAEGMGGTLKLEESTPGKGSVFGVTVPIVTPARLQRLKESTATLNLHTGLVSGEAAKADKPVAPKKSK